MLKATLLLLLTGAEGRLGQQPRRLGMFGGGMDESFASFNNAITASAPPIGDEGEPADDMGGEQAPPPPPLPPPLPIAQVLPPLGVDDATQDAPPPDESAPKILNQLKDEETEQWQNIFAAFDTDHSGGISRAP